MNGDRPHHHEPPELRARAAAGETSAHKPPHPERRRRAIAVLPQLADPVPMPPGEPPRTASTKAQRGEPARLRDQLEHPA
ncbi:hypothetical protein RCO28_33060 [Streptomyces sp. LHD-70]|uniref:hypothetical protein n=1 Tax=Streptomyces sp. LHD-70 TaxID=3072140 RepID=UPI00280CD685|nr:hypothetical protein [Streptomyces sp. LHD-70]MDQ8707263.1 hypothetical protein [Streptomyces sp. LHD-70]